MHSIWFHCLFSILFGIMIHDSEISLAIHILETMFHSYVCLAQVLKNFLDIAEADVRSLISLYSEVVSPVKVIFHLFLLFPWCCYWLVFCLLRGEFDAPSQIIVISLDYVDNQVCQLLIFWFWSWFFLFQGRSADSLSQYFGEDPARCPFEQGLIVSTI